MAPWILTFSLLAGQLIKIPLSNQGGITILDIVIIFLCLFGLIRLKFHLKKPTFFITAGLIFTLVALISLMLTPLHLKISEYFISLFYSVRFCSYILLSWIIFSGGLNKIKEQINKILTFSGIGLAILGLLQLIFLTNIDFLTSLGWDPHYFRTVSTFLDPNFLGGFFTLTLILIIQNDKRNLNILFFLIVYFGLLTTFSRGAYLSYGASFIILSILNKSAKLLFLTAFLCLGLFLGFNIYQHTVATPRNIDRIQSAEFRLNTWQQGLTLFQIAPILGVGFNSYRYGLREHHLAGEGFLKTHGSSTNDSSLLFVASTTGIIGLMSYALFLSTMLKSAWINYLQKNSWGVILISGIAGTFIQSFFANTLFYPFILIWIILVAINLT